jgi:hypothetical protein
MPWSEVNMHMQIEDKPMLCQLVGRMVQLFTLDGKPFSAPITRGEAGIFEENGAACVDSGGEKYVCGHREVPNIGPPS